ncbi:FAD-dependent monooxygenase [Actinomadura madurae]|uniref:FAD-dependent monooxygenase n=1 Tax=Actinomadura madurae TaxID=1993 RepID=UPI000D91D23E|nr:FAD-dependent monooxygenase [Actinomadura madurae]SPT51698.1 6-hydroxynicotinate 3-monooxygenase precursor [Actinomadura madurae]
MDIIVSGSSIAGLSAAYWLARSGHRVTVVEISPGVRRGGIAVDVRGGALEVAKDMGLHEEILRSRVPTADIYYFLDAAGTVKATFEPAVQFYDSPEDVEISRDRLSDILQDAVPAEVAFRYGLSLVSIREHGDGVEVALSDGTVHNCDLVVGADGMHSNVRSLTFGPERDHVRYLGLYVAIVKRCRTGRGMEGSHVYNSPGRMLMLRGDGEECSALLGFRSEPIDYDFRDLSAQRRIVKEAFRDDRAWKLPEVVAEIETAEDFYFDSVGQIRMPAWSRGRVVLLGDAAYCASFFSGMGTSLAMLGAFQLAQSLDSCGDDVAGGLAAYERAMRPVVDEAQAMADAGAAILFPETADAIEARNAELMAEAPMS